ncbi:hypothetical protein CRU98_11940 [Arcobacter sp. CECT 8986]|uniref:hypothetical protein n=1 Tax=Arcobacter sp. CECT 8986 TaxID=2044507 RepID=UPI001009E1F0|nr:hypothetical protein [Arcobacter sp. CECT 8986]RXJ97832.1 hypothetical protein CRU98_11940 [Arcobacter sp. CECT 8986]
MIFFVFVPTDVETEKITPWLLGINFTVAFFSINFTLFGYQLSKYKLIYHGISKRQWFNILLLLFLPFLPLISFLIIPLHFGNITLWLLPILFFLCIENVSLTIKYLSPEKFIEDSLSDSVISNYLHSLSLEIKKEINENEKYLNDREKYQFPTHAYDFEPSTLGLNPNDIWDSISVVVNLSIENNDYPIFRQSISAILKLIINFYSFKNEGNYKIERGIKYIARYRLKAIIINIIEKDKSGIYLQSLSSELCDFLMKEELLDNPCSDMTRSVVSDLVWISDKMIESNNLIEPIKALNFIHRLVEVNIYKLEKEENDDTSKVLDKYNIATYAHSIKHLGMTALNNGNSHFAYRCMETLSYLGCSAARLKSQQTIIAVLESIVNLGRLARKLRIGCFWSRCLIPAESHAEEFIGHIVTWLVKDIDSKGNFYLKPYIEQSYSRLRGFKCSVTFKNTDCYAIWIEELKKDGKKIPHIESESGMHGYCGKCDYSDFSNMKEYVLHGIGSNEDVIHMKGAPILID